MCLYVKNNTIRPTRKTVWKIIVTHRWTLEQHEPRFMTPFHYEPVTLGTTMVAQGELKYYGSSRGNNQLRIKAGAIHVFTNKHHVKKFKTWGSLRFYMVKCRVKSEHWIADGNNGDACYTEVFFTDEIINIPTTDC